MWARNVCALFFLGTLTLSLGCTSNSNPPTTPVSGVVTLDGKAISDCMVTFSPLSKTDGRPASATTDAAGKYTLGTFAGGDGAMKGSYEVTVTKIFTEAGESPYDAYKKPAEPAAAVKDQKLEDMYASYGKGYEGTPKDAGKGKPPASKNELPAKYGQTSTSGLKFDVTDTSATFDIAMKSK